MSSGGSVIDEDFAAEWAPQVALQEEMIVDVSFFEYTPSQEFISGIPRTTRFSF